MKSSRLWSHIGHGMPSPKNEPLWLAIFTKKEEKLLNFISLFVVSTLREKNVVVGTSGVLL